MLLFVVTVWYAGMDGTADEHMVVRNMLSIEINIYGKEMCIKLVIYKNYTGYCCLVMRRGG